MLLVGFRVACACGNRTPVPYGFVAAYDATSISLLPQLYRADAERSTEAATALRMLLGSALEGAAAALPALLDNSKVRSHLAGRGPSIRHSQSARLHNRLCIQSLTSPTVWRPSLQAQLHPDRAIQLLDRCSALADRLVPELRLPGTTTAHETLGPHGCCSA